MECSNELLAFLEPYREVENKTQLQKFRWLERESIDDNPTAGCAILIPYSREEEGDDEKKSEEEKYFRCMFPYVVGDHCSDPKDKESDNDMGEAPEKVERITWTIAESKISKPLGDLMTLKDADTRDHRKSKEGQSHSDTDEEKIHPAQHEMQNSL